MSKQQNDPAGEMSKPLADLLAAFREHRAGRSFLDEQSVRHDSSWDKFSIDCGINAHDEWVDALMQAIAVIPGATLQDALAKMALAYYSLRSEIDCPTEGADYKRHQFLASMLFSDARVIIERHCGISVEDLGLAELAETYNDPQRIIARARELADQVKQKRAA